MGWAGLESHLLGKLDPSLGAPPVWWLLQRPPQWSEWTAKSWELAISLDFRIHVCIFRAEYSNPIQTRKKMLTYMVSRQLALERDPGLGHTLYTLSEFIIYLLPTVGPRKTLFFHP